MVSVGRVDLTGRKQRVLVLNPLSGAMQLYSGRTLTRTCTETVNTGL